jgi:hypothetical protein
MLNPNEAPQMTQEPLRYESPLGRAIAIWSTGKNIPLTLAAQLMEDGYIVSDLERIHRKSR